MKNNRAIPSAATALFKTLFVFAIAGILSLMFTACHAQNGPDRKPDAATNTVPLPLSGPAISPPPPPPGNTTENNTRYSLSGSIDDPSILTPNPSPLADSVNAGATQSSQITSPQLDANPTDKMLGPMPNSLQSLSGDIESKIKRFKSAIDDAARNGHTFSSFPSGAQIKVVLDTVSFKASDTLADIGAGTGYFELTLLESRIPFHKLYAVDIDKNALDLLKYALDKFEYPNRNKVEVIQSELSDTLLPHEAIDVALIMRTPFYLEVIEGGGFQCLKSLYAAMKKDGRVHVFDSKRGEYPHLKANQKEFETIRLFQKAGFVYDNAKTGKEDSEFIYMVFAK
jgi:predicted RNA methylase